MIFSQNNLVTLKRQLLTREIFLVIAMLSLILIFSTRATAESAEKSDFNGNYTRDLQLPPTLRQARNENPESSFIFSTASDQVGVSVTVLPNLSLSVVAGEPRYATNNPFGMTVTVDDSRSPVVTWIATADY